MIERINGACYKSMLDYGVRNLNKYRKTVNKMNVFPVPDGDTGTNMVTTIKNGLLSIKNEDASLSEVSISFANAVVFGARGNSGVIVSQFFRGVSEVFGNVEWADAHKFTEALETGVKRAHEAVAKPVDGTILTVLKDATDHVRKNINSITSIDDLILFFIEKAKISLENTPELLPALKNAGVVDSGGAGVVYFFEGIKMYLDGEEPESIEDTLSDTSIDYSSYNTSSSFEYGYCIEFMLQLLDRKEEFHYVEFKAKLPSYGDSIVLSYDNNRVRVHIHSEDPGKVISFCQRFGEFLFMKIENMTVQHTETVKNILCSQRKHECKFSVIALAPDRKLQKTFLDMGADVVMYYDTNPATKDFIEAFKTVNTPEIILFPNSSDSIFSAMQAGNLYDEAVVKVVNCKSVAECYASLAIIDFLEEDTDVIINTINETIANLEIISIAHARKSRNYGQQSILKNDFYAFTGKELLTVGKKLDTLALKVINSVLIRDPDKSVLTLFHSKNVTEEQLNAIISVLNEEYIYIEVYTVPTEATVSDLIISFE